MPGARGRQLLRRAAQPQQAQRRHRSQPAGRSRHPLPAGADGRHLPHQLPARSAPAPADHLRGPDADQPAPDLRQGPRPGAEGSGRQPRRLRRVSRSGRAAPSPIGSPAPDSRSCSSAPRSATSSAACSSPAASPARSTTASAPGRHRGRRVAARQRRVDHVARHRRGDDLRLRAAAERRRRHAEPARQHLLVQRRQGHRPDDAAGRTLLADLRRTPSTARTSSPIRASTRRRSAQHEAADAGRAAGAMFATRPRADWAEMLQRLGVHLGAAAVADRDSQRSPGGRQRLRHGLRAPDARPVPRRREPGAVRQRRPDGAARPPPSSARTPKRCCSSSATRWEDIARQKDARRDRELRNPAQPGAERIRLHSPPRGDDPPRSARSASISSTRLRDRGRSGPRGRRR